MPDERAKAKRRHPTAQEMDERIVAPEGATFEDVVEALLNTPPLADGDESADSR